MYNYEQALSVKTFGKFHYRGRRHAGSWMRAICRSIIDPHLYRYRYRNRHLRDRYIFLQMPSIETIGTIAARYVAFLCGISVSQNQSLPVMLAVPSHVVENRFRLRVFSVYLSM